MKLKISRRISVRTCHCNVIRRHVTAIAHCETVELKTKIKLKSGVSDGIRRKYSSPVPSVPKSVREEEESKIVHKVVPPSFNQEGQP